MAESNRIVIAGGTGFLGLNLARFLAAAGHEVVLLSRHRPEESVLGAIGCLHARWDSRSLGAWADTLDGATALVNLAGRSVDCVKSPEHCDQILRSRVESTRVLGLAVHRAASPPTVWVQMSTAHIYGDPPALECTESSAFGYGLAPTVGKAWEAELERAAPNAMRRVVLRTSFVLGRSGGALPRLAVLVRWRLGGAVGHGRQGISWIHEHDMNRLFVRAIDDDAMSGAYLATAPNPVSNTDFMRALRRSLGIRIGLPAPAAMVRLAAPLVLRTDPELALSGRYCRSERLQELGFHFEFPDIASALDDLYTVGSRR